MDDVLSEVPTSDPEMSPDTGWSEYTPLISSSCLLKEGVRRPAPEVSGEALVCRRKICKK